MRRSSSFNSRAARRSVLSLGSMNFESQIECYEAIGAALASVAPAGWRSIEASITLDGARVDAVVSYKNAKGGSGYLTGVPMLARYFYELARLGSTEEKGLFKTCLFTLVSNGKYDSQLSY